VPGFYSQPKTVLDIVDQTLDRVLDLLNLPAGEARRWDGGKSAAKKSSRKAARKS